MEDYFLDRRCYMCDLGFYLVQYAQIPGKLDGWGISRNERRLKLDLC